MQLSTILISTLIAFTSAAPQTPQATFPSATLQLSNDQTGTTASAPVPANGVDIPISSLFANSPVGKWASSAQLTNFPQGVFCIITKKYQPLAILNFKKTFADLDGNPDVASPVSLEGAVVQCQI